MQSSNQLCFDDKMETMNKTNINTNPLFEFAYVDASLYEKLANLALEEVWFFGDKAPQNRPYPILEQYLKYTFCRLKKEGKIVIRKNIEDGKEYAAINTGLVDKKYDYIYALFEPNRNTSSSTPWYLRGFFVAGQDWGGKMLVNLFNPLPAKADYFGGKIQNMLFDSSTGDLIVDYDHIIRERIGRFPQEFIEDNISGIDTNIQGMNLEEAFQCRDYYAKESYFKELGARISNNSRVFKRMKDRLQDAVNFSIKRVEWNYKTAIPMYYPTEDKGSLLLPLALCDESHVDLALIVEKKQSGAYQGHTVLTLQMAYSNSRLVTRPDSDWLRTNLMKRPDEESDNN